MNSTIKDRLRAYAVLARLDRPIGIYLLLWPTLWALWIASEGRPNTWVVIVFVLGVILMRSAGCIMNDFADRDFDGHVKRTAQRPLPAGRVSAREALLLAGTLMLSALLLVLTLNWLTVGLAVIAALLAITYPFMKRYTYLPQVHLGLAFGWAIPMAFAAQIGAVPPVAWLILCASLLWTVAYDTIYAMVDRDDDIRIGIKSTAILFGSEDRLIIGIIQALLVAVLIVIGIRIELGEMYYVGIGAAALLAVYQQYLIRDREPDRCFKAFLNNHWLGVAVFMGLLSHYLSAY
ncbi:MAG: 4-hydroxybenzoate octaprenyltransferase [Gammaproteobacteria bacterium]|nr:4-hydroxybenzoate octaprenyltransferase [Gammaproteobacteria bacterium]